VKGRRTDMALDIKPSTRRRELLRALIGGFVGAMAGFGAAYLLYQWVNPIVEARNDWLEEFQGLLFNVVPLGTAIGAVVGWWVVRRFDRR